MKIKKIKFNIRFLLITINIVTTILLIIGFIYYKLMFESSSAEAWLLNGRNDDMYTRNIIFVSSVDYNKQFITGGSLYITNDNIINNSKSIKVEICYKYDDTCVFNYSLTSDIIGIVKKNNPLSIGSRSTTAFNDGFIKNKDGSKFKYIEDYLDKIQSMYLKMTVTFENNKDEIYELNISPNPKIHTRPSFYELPHKKE